MRCESVAHVLILRWQVLDSILISDGLKYQVSRVWIIKVSYFIWLLKRRMAAHLLKLILLCSLCR